MIILNYQGEVSIGTALGKLAGGVLMVGAIVGAFVFSRKSKEPTPPITSPAPPIIPTGSAR